MLILFYWFILRINTSKVSCLFVAEGVENSISIFYNLSIIFRSSGRHRRLDIRQPQRGGCLSVRAGRRRRRGASRLPYQPPGLSTRTSHLILRSSTVSYARTVTSPNKTFCPKHNIYTRRVVSEGFSAAPLGLTDICQFVFIVSTREFKFRRVLCCFCCIEAVNQILVKCILDYSSLLDNLWWV